MNTKEDKKKKKRGFWGWANKIMDKIISYVLIILLLFSLYSVYDSLYVYSHTSERFQNVFADDDVDRGIPDKAIGRIIIDGAGIDHPVMQGKTNNDYLDKDPYGEYSLVGSIFLDSRNNSKWKDRYNLLYGHHMANYQMFGALDQYREKDFFKTHTKGTLKTKNCDYELKIFAVIEASASDSILFNASEGTYDKALASYIKKHAFYYNEIHAKKYLAMSTCQSASSTERLIVVASMENPTKPGTLFEDEETEK